jgi:hypothetical protein
MSNAGGWIKLHRKILNSAFWVERREFSRAEAWIDLLLEARHNEEPAQVLIGNVSIECKRGQTVRSLSTWAGRWHWSKAKVRRFLRVAQEANMIRLENVTKTTRITICNYETYNGDRNDDETIMKRKRNALGTQTRRIRRKEHKNKIEADFDSPQFQAAWEEWQQHRKEKKKPLTPTAREKQIKKLNEMGEARAIAAIEYSIRQGWQGIYEESNKAGADSHFSKETGQHDNAW